MSKSLVSVVIRTLNEERYLDELLSKIGTQKSELFNVEVVIVDSGSTDETLSIAKKYNCRITHIKKEEFTFGRSLNIGCDFASGEYLVFISGHCIPCDNNWIENLVKPLINDCDYSYGRQLGRDSTKFSERQLFLKYFPDTSSIPQKGFFCNNANAAIRKDIWSKYQFDEQLTGCEDMYIAKEIVRNDGLIGYVASAPVFHIHEETWQKVRIRYEREAIALQQIMPQIHVSFFDMLMYIIVGVVKDLKMAFRQSVFFKEIYSILRFRFAQYYGAYKGNHINRKLSQQMKLKYFYPRVTDMNVTTEYKEIKGSDK